MRMKKVAGRWAKRDVLIAVAAAVFLVALVVAAMQTAGSSTHRHGQTQPNANLSAGWTISKSADVESEITHKATPLYIDEDTGVGVYASVPIDSEEVELPIIEDLVIAQGEDCLHAEGSCPACDELREMYRNGKLDGLRRITIVPEHDTPGMFEVRFPIGVETYKLTRYWCDGGMLRSTDSLAPSGHLSEASLNSDLRGIQVPMGYAIAR